MTHPGTFHVFQVRNSVIDAPLSGILKCSKMGPRGWRYVNPNDNSWSPESEYEPPIIGTSSNDAVLASRNAISPTVIGDFRNVLRAKFEIMVKVQFTVSTLYRAARTRILGMNNVNHTGNFTLQRPISLSTRQWKHARGF